MPRVEHDSGSSQPGTNNPRIKENITAHWLLFANNRHTYAGYSKLSEEAVDRLMCGGNPKSGEEIYAPYLQAIGKMVGHQKTNRH